MGTLTISYPQKSKAALLQILGALEQLGVKIESEEKSGRIHGLPYTYEERVAAIRRAEEDIEAGRLITHEQLKAKHPERWR